jgi:hypothetical protein
MLPGNSLILPVNVRLLPAIYESVRTVNDSIFGSNPFPLIRAAFSERPGAVKGAPSGAAKRTLTARTVLGQSAGKEKG